MSEGQLDRDLPQGLDGALVRGFDGQRRHHVLCAALIAIPRGLHGRGMSEVALHAMGELARSNALSSLIAPVRPNWKERYPLVPTERCARWRRADGLLFDPWMRVHELRSARAEARGALGSHRRNRHRMGGMDVGVAAEEARERGFVVLSARPVAAEARLAYGALGDLLAPVPDESLRRLARPLRTALDTALLRAGAQESAPDRRAVCAAVLAILENLATRAPVLVAAR